MENMGRAISLLHSVIFVGYSGELMESLEWFLRMLSSKDIIQEKEQKVIFSFVCLSVIPFPKRKMDQMVFLALVPLAV